MDARPLQVFYGGTFDPVHCGHLAIAHAAHEALQADVRLMPAADPPHRPPPGADAQHRARMLDLAVADRPGLLVDRRELQRAAADSKVPSYSVDTLGHLRQEIGDTAPVAWLLGADSFVSLPQWHQWQRLFGLTHLIVAEREGSPLEQGLPPELDAMLQGRWTRDAQDLRQAPAGRVLPLRQPLHAGSATDLRARIAGGHPWHERVPKAVAAYIERHGLYGAGADTAPRL
jgi:nicotinate-nucleotide adenylyltransferase